MEFQGAKSSRAPSELTAIGSQSDDEREKEKLDSAQGTGRSTPEPTEAPSKETVTIPAPPPLPTTTTITATATPSAGAAAVQTPQKGYRHRSSSIAWPDPPTRPRTPPAAADPDAPCLTRVLSRVASRLSTRSDRATPPPPPDGGTRAWLVVLGAHLAVLNTWGLVSSYGLFQTYYATVLSRPPSDISWIGSVQIFLLFFVGTFTGRLTDAGYFRAVFTAGTVLVVGGLFATAQCAAYWQFMLAQGIVIGLGYGCLFCPAMTLVSTYFDKKRGFVIGIVTCGSTTGGLIFPGMARQLLPQIGFAWTMRAFAFIVLGTMAVAHVCMRTRIPPRRHGSLVDWASFKEMEYVCFAAGAFCCFWGIYFAFFYLASYSRTQLADDALSYTDSLNLLLILNGVGVLGRLVPSRLADRVGPLNVFVPTAAATGLLMLCWAAVGGRAGLYAWAVLYGVLAGGLQSMFPASLTSLTTDLRRAGVRLGMAFTIVSFAVLTGPPIAGALVSACGGRYYGAQVFAGVSILVGCGLVVVARMAGVRKVGGGWRTKI